MQINKTYLAETAEQLGSIAEQLLVDSTYPLILFRGDLGAGKTSLIKAMIKHLGSEDSGSSPSYAIINTYSLESGLLYHVDLYRLNSPEEVFQLGIEEVLYSGDYCFVEWPQIIEDYIKPPYHLIDIEILENNTRKISIV